MIEQEPLTAAPLVVLDTNTVLDLALFCDRAAMPLRTAIAQRRLQWVVTEPMLSELGFVLARPRLGRWHPADGAGQVTAFVQKNAHRVVTPPADSPPAPICRDPADQMFIDLAWSVHAAWLLSRDKALLSLARRSAGRGLRIGTPAQWARTNGAAPESEAEATPLLQRRLE